jgi:hypothetical protein
VLLWIISKLKDANTKIILACLLSFMQLSQKLWLCNIYVYILCHKICVCFIYASVQNIFLSINIYQVSLELWTEMHVGLHIKYSLLLSHFNQNWSMVINLWPSIILNLKEISKGFLHSLHTDHQRDKQCCAACILENRHMRCDCSLMTDLFLWQI